MKISQLFINNAMRASTWIKDNVTTAIILVKHATIKVEITAFLVNPILLKSTISVLINVIKRHILVNSTKLIYIIDMNQSQCVL
jgi:hypothetical protein